MELEDSEKCTTSDLILRQLLEEQKTITEFLSAVFGFLKRNTDFYHVKVNEDDKYGFLKGMKERIVLSCLQKYDLKCMSQQVEVPPMEKEVEVISDNVDADINEPDNSSLKKSTIEAKEVESLTTFNKADYKNGAIFENYCWSQTMKDVEVYVKMPPNVQCSKRVKVELTSNSVKIKCTMPEEVIILDGLVWSKFKYNDAVWTLVEGKLHLSLDKCHEIWWDKLFLSEPSIDVTKLDSVRCIHELPVESQVAINKLRVEEVEKWKGKNSKPMDKEQIKLLKKAWNAKGSPFKGQPFDPSRIQFN